MKDYKFSWKGHLLISICLIVSSSFSKAQDDLPVERKWATYISQSTAYNKDGGFYLHGFFHSTNQNPYTSYASYFDDTETIRKSYIGMIDSTMNISYMNFIGEPYDGETQGTMNLNFFSQIKKSDNYASGFYIYGHTFLSQGISTPGAYQENFSNNWTPDTEQYFPNVDTTITVPGELCYDGFLMKFDEQGNKLWGSYINGNWDFKIRNLVEQNGYVYILGITNSNTGLGTPGTYMPNWLNDTLNYSTKRRMFEAKFDASNGQMIWGTYLDDISYSFGITGMGSDFSEFTVNSNGYSYILVKDSILVLNPSGTLDTLLEFPINLEYLVYYNGYIDNNDTTGEFYNHIADLQFESDDYGNIYIIGQCGFDTIGESNGIGTPGSFRPLKTEQYQYFLLKCNSLGQVLWGTYLPDHAVISEGNMYKHQYAMFLGKNAVYIGTSTVESGIATPGAYQDSIGGESDAIIMKLDNNDGSLIWATYYGGHKNERNVVSLGVDNEDNIYFQIITNDFYSYYNNPVVPNDALFPEQIYGGNFLVKLGLAGNGGDDGGNDGGSDGGDGGDDGGNEDGEGDVGIVENDAVKDFLLFPNPANNMLFVQSPYAIARNSQIHIYDLSGRRMITTSGQNTEIIQVDVSSLSNGLYIIEIQHDDFSKRLKFVKD